MFYQRGRAGNSLPHQGMAALRGWGEAWSGAVDGQLDRRQHDRL